MSNQSYPSVNDYEISWSSIGITANVDGGGSLDAIDCEGIKWSSKLESSYTYGTSGGHPLKETEGKRSYEASAVFSKAGIETLKRALMALAPSRSGIKILSYPRFTVVVQHSTIANPSVVYTTKLKGCRYRGESEDNKEGVDALLNEIDLKPIAITHMIDGEEVSL